MTNTESAAETDTAAAYAALSSGTATGERADILETLRTHRFFLRHTVEGLTDEQARLTPTASELTLGGLIKHVASTESGWVDFIEKGPAAMPTVEGEFDSNPSWPSSGRTSSSCSPTRPWRTSWRATSRWPRGRMRWSSRCPTSTPSHPLPPAPWFAPGATRSARRVFLHIVAETAQHSGHADIIRETIDGQKTMG